MALLKRPLLRVRVIASRIVRPGTARERQRRETIPCWSWESHVDLHTLPSKRDLQVSVDVYEPVVRNGRRGGRAEQLRGRDHGPRRRRGGRLRARYRGSARRGRGRGTGAWWSMYRAARGASHLRCGRSGARRESRGRLPPSRVAQHRGCCDPRARSASEMVSWSSQHRGLASVAGRLRGPGLGSRTSGCAQGSPPAVVARQRPRPGEALRPPAIMPRPVRSAPGHRVLGLHARACDLRL